MQGAAVSDPAQICITASPVQEPRLQSAAHPTATMAPGVQVRTPPAMVRPQVRGTPLRQLVPPSKPGQLERVYAQSAPMQSAEPVEVPCWQRLVRRHQPQEPSGVQVSQVVAAAHVAAASTGGITPPPSPHWLESQAQLAPMQVPSREPVEVPDKQRFPHQPQVPIAVHAPQAVAEAQLSPPSPVAPGRSIPLAVPLSTVVMGPVPPLVPQPSDITSNSAALPILNCMCPSLRFENRPDGPPGGRWRRRPQM